MRVRKPLFVKSLIFWRQNLVTRFSFINLGEHYILTFVRKADNWWPNDKVWDRTEGVPVIEEVKKSSIEKIEINAD